MTIHADVGNNYKGIMREIILITLILFRFQLIFCQGTDDSSSTSKIDFNKISVQDYIKLLPIEKNDTKQFHILTIFSTAKNGWIKESDIDTLINLINSSQ